MKTIDNDNKLSETTKIARKILLKQQILWSKQMIKTNLIKTAAKVVNDNKFSETTVIMVKQ